MKFLKRGILALPLTATVGLAADYEIFTATVSVETELNHHAPQ